MELLVCQNSEEFQTSHNPRTDHHNRYHIVIVDCLSAFDIFDDDTLNFSIQTLRNINDMQMCWDVAREVWLQRYSANEPPPPRSEPAPANQRPQIVDPIIIGCNVITEATNAMDSGNYSAE